MARKKTNKRSETAVRRTVREQRFSSDKENVIWLFDRIDTAGEFAFDLNTISADGNLKEIFEKMIAYSSMTWAQIKQQTHDNGKSKHHLLDVDSLSPIAQKRVEFKQMEEETDAIFSFALQNTLRVIGIRENQFFHVVWYDKNHSFCPSKKKHT